jgi:hypothetical protein
MIRYPADFPPESRAAVVAEKVRAGKDFDSARQELPGSFHGALEAELRRYVLRLFGVFVREACTLGRKGLWSPDRLEKEALEFLRLVTIDAISEKAYDKSGRKFAGGWIENWAGSLQPEVRREFQRSAEWQQFQDALLEVAECHEAPASESDGLVHKIGSDQKRGRSRIVDDFLDRCNRDPAADFKVIRKHVWQLAGHANARQFQYWQEGSDKATDEDNRKFRQILHLPPQQFIALVKKKNLVLNKS